MVNFAKLAIADTDAKTGGAKFVAFLNANFATGPGVTGWIMTVVLGVMVFFAIEKRKRANFEHFWYSHHLFIVFFICWQLHGMFCMIKPDRPPFCSWNTIGVFWVRLFPFHSKPIRNLILFCYSVTGLSVASSGFGSVSSVKFVLVIGRTSLRSSSTPRT